MAGDAESPAARGLGIRPLTLLSRCPYVRWRRDTQRARKLHQSDIVHCFETDALASLAPRGVMAWCWGTLRGGACPCKKDMIMIAACSAPCRRWGEHGVLGISVITHLRESLTDPVRNSAQSGRQSGIPALMCVSYCSQSLATGWCSKSGTVISFNEPLCAVTGGNKDFTDTQQGSDPAPCPTC